MPNEDRVRLTVFLPLDKVRLVDEAMASQRRVDPRRKVSRASIICDAIEFGVHGLRGASMDRAAVSASQEGAHP